MESERTTSDPDFRVLHDSKEVSEELERAEHDVVYADRSWLGRIEVRGPDGIDLLQRISTNDLLGEDTAGEMATVLTTDKGRIVDVARVLRQPEPPLLIVSEGNQKKVIDHIDRYVLMDDVSLSDVTSETTAYSIIGPHALSIVERTFGPCSELSKTQLVSPFGFDILVSKDSYLGLRCINLICRREFESAFQARLGQIIDARISRPAYDLFRISKGIPTIGHEITNQFNPYEIGLESLISYTKGCYVGQEVIARLNTYQKVQREMWGIRLDNGQIEVEVPRDLTKDGNPVGRITSLSAAQHGGTRYGLAVLKKGIGREGVDVDISETGITAQLASLPMRLS